MIDKQQLKKLQLQLYRAKMKEILADKELDMKFFNRQEHEQTFHRVLFKNNEAFAKKPKFAFMKRVKSPKYHERINILKAFLDGEDRYWQWSWREFFIVRILDVRNPMEIPWEMEQNFPVYRKEILNQARQRGWAKYNPKKDEWSLV